MHVLVYTHIYTPHKHALTHINRKTWPKSQLCVALPAPCASWQNSPTSSCVCDDQTMQGQDSVKMSFKAWGTIKFWKTYPGSFHQSETRGKEGRWVFAILKAEWVGSCRKWEHTERAGRRWLRWDERKQYEMHLLSSPGFQNPVGLFAFLLSQCKMLSVEGWGGHLPISCWKIILNVLWTWKNNWIYIVNMF